jgi:hypothetical protein
MKISMSFWQDRRYLKATMNDRGEAEQMEKHFG